MVLWYDCFFFCKTEKNLFTFPRLRFGSELKLFLYTVKRLCTQRRPSKFYVGLWRLQELFAAGRDNKCSESCGGQTKGHRGLLVLSLHTPAPLNIDRDRQHCLVQRSTNRWIIVKFCFSLISRLKHASFHLYCDRKSWIFQWFKWSKSISTCNRLFSYLQS